MGIAAAVGVSLQNRAQLSDVALANIEALASGEASIGSVGHETLCNVGGINMGGSDNRGMFGYDRLVRWSRRRLHSGSLP